MKKQMNLNGRKVRTNENSKIRIAEVVKEWMEYDNEGNGKKFQQIEWRTITKPTSLGSVANPNKKIARVEFDVPEDKNKDSRINLNNFFKFE